MKIKSSRTKYFLKKGYQVVVSALAFIINTFGFVFSVADIRNATTTTEKYAFIILCVAEIFLIASVIYTVFAFARGVNIKEAVTDKNAELQRYIDANKLVFENQKNLITYYKDFSDRLKTGVKKYDNKCDIIKNLKDDLDNNSSVIDTADMEKQLHENSKVLLHDFRNSLIEQYNRFMEKTVDGLKDSIEEYLSTKGCNVSVSVAIKQLDEKVNYRNIDDQAENIYTAFRDSRTYWSKKRNETWEKNFCISKNSDFVVSIEKDYYIFNYMNRNFVEDGLYLNENSSFYEHYNSGVTSSIYSCVDGEKVLFGFLACDSFLDGKIRQKHGKNIYDYNVANMLMAAAHIIALYLGEFLEVWNGKYMDEAFKVEYPNISQSKEAKARAEFEKKDNFCTYMRRKYQSARYKR